jgi:hypothetical protein
LHFLFQSKELWMIGAKSEAVVERRQRVDNALMPASAEFVGIFETVVRILPAFADAGLVRE